MGIKSYEQELSDILAMMGATLKGSSQDKKSLAQAWLMVVRGQVDQEWLSETCAWFLLHAMWFPTPSEFIAKATDIRDRHEMDTVLEETKRQLLEQEQYAAIGRRQRNIDAGIDPDAPLPIEAINPLLGGLTNNMLPASTDAAQDEADK